MVITIPPDLEAVLNERARREGVSAETLALNTLRKWFIVPPPRDEWERLLRQAASDCGVSLPHWALSSEGIYD
ncbi:MAG TPA: hypothetical protein VH682_20155 [Gemmataceae bacterium]|jgi:hypothetical protein